jgi:hypothetical protein
MRKLIPLLILVLFVGYARADTPLPVVRGGLTWNVYAKLTIPAPAPPNTTPYSPQLNSPTQPSPTITIFDPSGSIVVNAANMTQVNDLRGKPIVGTFVYEWITPTSPLGTYSCWINVLGPDGNPGGSANQNPAQQATPIIQIV